MRRFLGVVAGVVIYLTVVALGVGALLLLTGFFHWMSFGKWPR